MSDSQAKYHHLMVWWGENALDQELEAWQKLKQLEALYHIESFLEVDTRDEWDAMHSQRTADGWELTNTGSGWMRRISGYKKLIE